MQFTEPYDSLYSEVIGPVCEELEFEAYRADDVFRPGIILQDIISGLVESDVIIAEISPTNANVFYELGYAHARNQPTVLLARRAERDTLITHRSLSSRTNGGGRFHSDLPRFRSYAVRTHQSGKLGMTSSISMRCEFAQPSLFSS